MLHPLRVLIVEDSKGDAELMEIELQRGGYDLLAERVETAAAMRAALSGQGWDIILADYTLPQFSGIAALRLLQESGLDLPLIIVTGTLGEESAVDAMRAGAKDYILKSNLSRLPAVVARELGEAVSRQERRRTAFEFAALMDCSEDAIIGKTMDGLITTWNPAAERLYGWTAAEARGRSIFFLVPPEGVEELAHLHRRLMQGERIAPYESVRLHKNGQRVEVSVTLSAIKDVTGKLIGTYSIARDITEHKRLEEQYRQAQKMEAIGQLAAGVAHDFNNLLTVITSYSEILLRQLPEELTDREPLLEITKAAARAAALTRQLLTFSRQQILAPKVMDLNSVVLDVERMLRRVIGEDIELATNLQPNLDRIKADPGQIEQVLMNLFVNARDAMPAGGKLTVETRNVELAEAYVQKHAEAHSGPHILLAVRDTGHGMTAQVKERLFEPFFTTKEKGRGTGLGLATVYGIVKANAGHITVFSEPDAGALFKIYLPRAAAALAAAHPAPAFVLGLGGDETVLLVEDEDTVRAIARTTLESNGYKVLEASQGDEALQLAQQFGAPIHLLLSDVVMPGLGGRQLAEQLLGVRPDMKVLFFSGYTDDAVVRHGVFQEKVNFLAKPFTPDVLACKVREVLDASHDPYTIECT